MSAPYRRDIDFGRYRCSKCLSFDCDPFRCGSCRGPIEDSPMFRPFEPFDPDFENPEKVAKFPSPAVYKGSYEIEIQKPTSSGFCSSFQNGPHTYYRLKHGEEYRVKMSNNTADHINALLKIDSDVMGKWRLGPYSSAVIERPAHNSRKFVFVSEDSTEAKSSGVRQGAESDLNGLIEVTFIPLKSNCTRLCARSPMVWSNSNNAVPYSNSANSAKAFDSLNLSNSSNLESQSFSRSNAAQSTYSAGATVLGGDSNQKFDTASEMEEDRARATKKMVRIVIDNRGPYTSIRERDRNSHDDEYDVPPKLPNRSDMLER